MGPLQGIRIIELAGLGPAPFCAMMLADMGATVIRVDRASAQPAEAAPVDTLLRNRRSIALNLKIPAGIAALLRLIDGADALTDERLARLYSAIHQLKPLERSLILLSLDGLSYREMAEVLGLSESNVGVKLNRIKAQLTLTLKGNEHEP